jgi:hypothetical protein
MTDDSPKQPKPMSRQSKKIIKVSIESISKTMMEHIGLWAQLIMAAAALVAIAMSLYSVSKTEKIADKSNDVVQKVAEKNNEVVTKINDESIKVTKNLHSIDEQLQRSNVELVKANNELSKSNIEQQRISWCLSLLSQLTSDNPRLQTSAAVTFAELDKKKAIPEYLYAALLAAKDDPKTNPDAVKILEGLLRKQMGRTTLLGSNVFGSKFPISLDNKRFVLVRAEKGKHYVSVIVTDGLIAKFEVVDNVPCLNSLSHVFATDSGVLISSDLKDGTKVYTMSMKDGIEITYGGPNTTNIKISRETVQAGGVTLTHNQIYAPVGIVVMKEGGVGIGSAYIPPAVNDLYNKATANIMAYPY